MSTQTQTAESQENDPNRDPVLVDDWHVVARTKDVREGKVMKVRLLGEDLVVWRHEGRVMAWKDLCIHRGARLSMGWVENGEVVCPYHGWRYNCEGACTLMPAHPDQAPPKKAHAFVHRVEEKYDWIWVSLGNPDHDVPPFFQWDDPGFRKFQAGPYYYRANGFRTIENFVDASHFPYVHAGLNGVPANPDVIKPYKVHRGEHGLYTDEIDVFQPFGDHRGRPVNSGYTYHCFRPLTAYFSKHTVLTDGTGGGDDRFCTFTTVQPIEENESVVWLGIAINFGPELTETDILERQDQVFEQDREIVESQRPEKIPLNLREELHVRCDKLAIEYRKWLKEQGLTFGAA
jgi:phenylpropionate dioxygenase-like ring-hydroxylating dioxygenase large terminal subunit